MFWPQLGPRPERSASERAGTYVPREAGRRRSESLTCFAEQVATQLVPSRLGGEEGIGAVQQFGFNEGVVKYFFDLIEREFPWRHNVSTA